MIDSTALIRDGEYTSKVFAVDDNAYGVVKKNGRGWRRFALHIGIEIDSVISALVVRSVIEFQPIAEEWTK